MIGIDNSPDMLEVAQEKRVESGLDILYLMQDMREFELYGTVRAVVSICDCMNYIWRKKIFWRSSGWSTIIWIRAESLSLI